MKGFRFVHASDLHLDSPFRGLSEVAPALQTALREATFQAMQGIVNLCLQREVDFLLIAGDIHDSADRSLRALARLRSEFERLAEHHIPVFLCHGNHDPLSGWGAKFTWPDNVHVFRADEVECKPVCRKGVEIARVYGVSYGTERVSENLARGFHKEADAPWSIGLLHTNVGGDPNHENYAPCDLPDLLQAGMDYWALGHVHSYRVLHSAQPLILYPGNPQGRHPRETGPRGCVAVDVHESGKVEHEFIPVDVVRWHDEAVDIQGLRDSEELFTDLDDRIHALRQQHDGRGLVVRWKLEGRGPLHQELTKPGRLEDLLATIRDKWGTGSSFVWSESLIDTSRPDVDVAALREEDNLLGDFLRLTQEPNPEFLREVEQSLTPLFEDPRILRHVPPPSPEQLVEWLEAAERLGIDRLVGGGE